MLLHQPAAPHGLVVQEPHEGHRCALALAGNWAECRRAGVVGLLCAGMGCGAVSGARQDLLVCLKGARCARGDGDVLGELRQRCQRLAPALLLALGGAEALAQQRNAGGRDAAAIVFDRQRPGRDVGGDLDAACARLKAVEHQLTGCAGQVCGLPMGCGANCVCHMLRQPPDLLGGNDAACV